MMQCSRLDCTQDNILSIIPFKSIQSICLTHSLDHIQFISLRKKCVCLFLFMNIQSKSEQSCVKSTENWKDFCKATWVIIKKMNPIVVFYTYLFIFHISLFLRYCISVYTHSKVRLQVRFMTRRISPLSLSLCIKILLCTALL